MDLGPVHTHAVGRLDTELDPMRAALQDLDEDAATILQHQHHPGLIARAGLARQN